MRGKNKMEHIAVSVIVPIYNAEPWLEECVQSILDQDFPASYGTIEVLLIDDGDGFGSGVRLKFGRKQAQAIGAWEDEGGVVGDDDVP